MNERLRTISLRCLLPLLMLTAGLALPVRAAEYSESSLTGRRAFELSDEGLSLSLHWGQGSKLDMVGWFEADGEGNVSGERVVRRQTLRWMSTRTEVLGTLGRQDLVERQAFSGTYEVDADGMARFELTTTPVSIWRWGPSGGGMQAEMRPEETWHLVLNEGGRSAVVLSTATAWATARDYEGLVDFQLKGESKRDQPPVATFLPRAPVLSR